MDSSLAFGQWLKARRKELDLTQWDVAARLGCAESTIQKFEVGERRPSKQMAGLLADALAIPTQERDAFLAHARGNDVRVAPAGGEAALAQTLPAWQTVPPALPAPAPLTRLIGRDAVVEELRATLRTGPARIVTLTGPPGVGKTRLAAAVAAAAQADYAGGARFVRLAAVRDVALLPAALATAFGLDASLPPLVALQTHLRDQECLLVLDNFEQILAGAPLLVELVRACPGVRALVTSRAALNVRGEQLWPVPPLAVPDPATSPALDDLAAHPAVALFVERAQMVQPGFTLTARNAAAVAAICARLDGLPLAIELAAARSRLLPPDALLARLDSRLALLTRGPQDLPRHQQTLRDAIAWSYDLLPPGAQTLFLRLGVFVGGWTLSAAEAVGNALGDLPAPVLDALTTLLDHSLVRQSGDDGAELRFTMLETIGEYALELLATSAEADTVRRLHAEYFLALTQASEAELNGADSAAVLERLAAEQGNIAAAFRWSLEADAGATALRLGACYWRVCERHADLNTGRYWLETTLAATDQAPSRERGRVLLGAGRLAWLQGDYTAARAYTERSVAAFRAVGAKVDLSKALHSLAVQLGTRGATAQAQACYEESLALMREAGDQAGVARVLNSLGVEARARGEYERAANLFGESLAIHRRLGNANSVSLLLANLAYVAHAEGDYARAGRLFAESLALRRDLGHRIGMEDCLVGLAAVAARQGAVDRAARLFGAAEALGAAIGYSLEPDDRTWAEREVAALRAHAEAAVVAVAWAAGRALPLDEALAYALMERT